MIEPRTGRCLHCGGEVLLERAEHHRAAECPVKRGPTFYNGDPDAYLPLEFGGVGPAGPDYDERQLAELYELRDGYWQPRGFQR